MITFLAAAATTYGSLNPRLLGAILVGTAIYTFWELAWILNTILCAHQPGRARSARSSARPPERASFRDGTSSALESDTEESRHARFPPRHLRVQGC